MDRWNDPDKRARWYEQLDSLHQRMEDLRGAMMEAPIEEAAIFMRARHRLDAERRALLKEGPT